MTTPAWDNLDDFLDADDFAVVVQVTMRSGQTRRVRGIYDGPYRHAQLADTDRDTIAPTFTAKAADLAGIKRGDLVVIQGEGPFGVLTEPQPDGHGMAVLELAPE